MTSKLTTDYLFLELSLYNEQTIDDFELIDSIKSPFNETQFDSYCIHCKKESTFKKYIEDESVPIGSATVYVDSFVDPGDTETPEQKMYKNIQGELSLEFQCQRDHQHTYNFYFKVTDDKIMKIGQYPSIADLELHKIDKYRPLLKNDYRDFSKAIGLYSHGIGAGSYVYLRRIFENIINEQKKIALESNPSLTEEVFNEKRMDKKIKYIEKFLPETLVKNRQIYSILSKGIHELSEQECLEMFPKLELGIEIILDWKLAEKEKQDKEKRLSKFISETVGKFKS